MAQPPRELFEFLKDAELEHYYNGFKSDLKVTTVQQIKYVEDEDLQDLGMTKPEMRRLKKFYKKECPHSTFSKIKKVSQYTSTEQTSDTCMHVLRSGFKSGFF